MRKLFLLTKFENFLEVIRKKLFLLSRHFTIIISSILITFLVSLLTSFFFYERSILSQKKLYDNFALNIEETLNDTFDNTFKYLKHVSKAILKNEDNSLERITIILMNERNNDYIEKNLYSWTFLDWIDSKNQLIVNSGIGKYEKPIDLSHRKHLKHGAQNPWHLFFSEHMIGQASGDHVVTLSMAITNKNGFFGTIALSILVQSLKDKINRYLLGADFDYFVLNQFGEVMLNSQGQIDVMNHDIFNQNLGYLNLDNLKNQIYRYSTFNRETKFVYLSRRYPFYIVIKVNNTLEKFISIFLEHLLMALIINTIFISFFIYYHNYITKLIFTLRSNLTERYTRDREKATHFDCNVPEVTKLSVLLNKIIDDNLNFQEQTLEYKLKCEQFIKEKNYVFYDFLGQVNVILQLSNDNVKNILNSWEKTAERDRCNSLKLTYDYELKIITMLHKYLAASENYQPELDLKKQIDIVMLVKKAIANVKSSLNDYENNVQINIKVDSDLSQYITCDTKKILLVLEKLIEFSLGASKEKIHIDISIKNFVQGSDFVSLYIWYSRDSITQEEENLFFHPFSQAPQYDLLNRKIDGLDLALSKKLIKLHNGTIWIENNREKGGVNICLTLPLASNHDKKIKEKYTIRTNDGHINLSQREIECAKLLVKGEAIKGIAKELNINVRTVEVHVKNLKLKTGTLYKSELIKFLRNNLNLEF